MINKNQLVGLIHQNSFIADASKNPDEKAASKGITDLLCNGKFQK